MSTKNSSEALQKPQDKFDQSISVLTPREIVDELDHFIIGQDDAKRAVAVALRTRWRRMQLSEDFRVEVTPKNILMTGPTGVGKTEIARRLAKLAGAPFIKVEATKFTEIGYVGRDVESIIRDLVEISIKMVREEAFAKVRSRAEDAAEQRILDVLLPQPSAMQNKQPATAGGPESSETKQEEMQDISSTRKKFLIKLRKGDLDDTEIELETKGAAIGVEIMTPPGMEEMTSQLSSMLQNIAGEKKRKRKLKIKDAKRILRDEEASKLLNDEDLKTKALETVEQNGIVFIDEIDKITRSSESNRSADISREGVQRDLLPLIEGCTVSTRYGTIKTDHILFVASGAFHVAKPSDLIPELQGRLPIRVELKALSTKDFVLILTKPKASLTKQYAALLKTEGIKLVFTKDGVERIASISWELNEQNENIGARRLHTVMERLLETISFSAPDKSGTTVRITSKYVNGQLNKLLKDRDLSQYIL